MAGTCFNADTLFYVAVSAYERLAGVEDDLDGGKVDALTCVLFSAAALEAFIAEFPRALEADAARNISTFREIAKLIDELEEARGSVNLKFDVARFALAGSIYDHGSEPFQSFISLFSFRNELVHMKPQNVPALEDPEVSHRIIKRLNGMGLSHGLEHGVLQTWLAPVSTRATARWACNTAADMVQSLVSLLPETIGERPLVAQLIAGQFKRVAESHWVRQPAERNPHAPPPLHPLSGYSHPTKRAD